MVGGGHHFICLEILILQQGCSSKGESEPCPCVCYDRCIWLPVFFSYFFCHSCWLCCILVPSLRLLQRQGDWMKTSISCQSLFGCTYLSLFHVVGKYDCEVGCVIHMPKKVFSQLFYSPLAEIFNLALLGLLTFLSKSFSLRWAEVWVQSEQWTSLQISFIICASVSHWVVPRWSVAAQFAYEAVIHRVHLSTSTVDGYVFHLPYLMQTASVNSCLFSAYPSSLVYNSPSPSSRMMMSLIEAGGNC